METMMTTEPDVWNKQYRTQIGVRYWPSEELVRYVSKLGRGKPGQEVLDLGCGTGANARFLLEHGYSVMCVDIAGNAVEVARSILNDKVKLRDNQHVFYKEGSCLDLSQEWTDRFRMVIDVQTLQHIPYSHHLSAYHHIGRVLEPDGVFFSMHFNDVHWDAKYIQQNELDEYTARDVTSPEALYPNNGITCFMPYHKQRDLLTKAGFAIDYHEVVSRGYASGRKFASYWVIGARKIKESQE